CRLTIPYEFSHERFKLRDIIYFILNLFKFILECYRTIKIYLHFRSGKNQCTFFRIPFYRSILRFFAYKFMNGLFRQMNTEWIPTIICCPYKKKLPANRNVQTILKHAVHITRRMVGKEKSNMLLIFLHL